MITMAVIIMGRSKCLCMRPAFGAGLDRELTGASCGSCLFSLTNKSIRQRADRRARLDDDHGARRAIERRSYRLFSRSLSLSRLKNKTNKKRKKKHARYGPDETRETDGRPYRRNSAADSGLSLVVGKALCASRKTSEDIGMGRVAVRGG